MEPGKASVDGSPKSRFPFRQPLHQLAAFDAVLDQQRRTQRKGDSAVSGVACVEGLQLG